MCHSPQDTLLDPAEMSVLIYRVDVEHFRIH